MTAYTDKLAPAMIGEDKLVVSVDSSSLPLLALSPIIINIDYSAAELEGGVALPIEAIVQPPSDDGSGYIRRKFSLKIPTSFVFTPLHAGRHLVLVKECCHNLWQGRLLIDVGGDEADKIWISERTV